jgi:UDP-N-acetylmuramoylalanine--D-glutamate ligase
MDGCYGVRVIDGERYLCRGDETLMAASELIIPGGHNLANALAAWAMADLLDIPDRAKRAVLARFRGLPHRTQLVIEQGDIRWYNDSKGTNLGATIAALEGLVHNGQPSRVVLIAGGDCKGADFTDLAPVAERTARAVVLIGRDAAKIETVLKGRVPLVRAENMGQAVELAATYAEPGDSVLLSPACASFDMYDNYLQRGDIFAATVEAMLR